MARLLNREGFLNRFAFKDVELNDGATVRIRALPSSYIVSEVEGRFASAKMLVNSLCNEDGTLMFTGEEGEQAMTIDMASLNLIMEAIVELNGLKKNIGEASPAEKN